MSYICICISHVVMMKSPFKASDSAINVKHAPWFAGFNLEILFWRKVHKCLRFGWPHPLSLNHTHLISAIIVSKKLQLIIS